MSSIFQGMLLLLITGVFQGSFVIFYKYHPVRFLYFWLVFILTGLFFIPLLLLLIMFPSWESVVFSIATVNLVLPVIFGALWGVGLLLFTNSIMVNGFSSTYTVSVGTSTLLGIVFPLLFYKVVIPGRIIILLGLAFLLLIVGIIIGIKVLLERTKNKRGLGVALLAAVFSPFLSIAYYFANPIFVTAQQFHASAFVAALLTWSMILFAACMGMLVYSGFRLGIIPFRAELPIQKKTALWTGVIAGIVWFGGFILYETGPEKLGEFGNAFGWAIMTIVSILTATFWGIRFGELKNKRLFRLQIFSLVFLFVGMGILGLTLFLKK